MTREQKADLRWFLKNEAHRTDLDLADDVGCTVGTVRKYRKVFAPSPPLSNKDNTDATE